MRLGWALCMTLATASPAFARELRESPSALAPGGGFFVDPALSLRQLYAFPNPSRRGQAVTIRLQTGLAETALLNIYDVAGHRVHSAEFSPPRVFDDGNGKGPQYTYDYEWDVSGVGSGIYIYAVTIKKPGEGVISKTGKVAVIK